MIEFVYGSFVALAVGCLALQYFKQDKISQQSFANNPQFLAFQKIYFCVYFLALFSDWLQGPYVYKLYSYYGFSEYQIAMLYVVGFASSVIFGTSTGPLADKFGSKLPICIKPDGSQINSYFKLVN